MRRPRLLSVFFLVLASALALLAFAACTEPPEPSYLLDGPRILAIRAEPPALVPGGQVTLDALVYAPPGSPEPEYEWSWCASLGSTQECTTSAEMLAGILDRVSVDAGADGGENEGPVAITYPIGKGPSVPFAYPLPADVAEALCEESRPDTDAGDDDAGADAGDDGGADAGARFGLFCRPDGWTAYVMLTVKVGDRTMRATRELTAHFTTPSSINANPSVLGLEPFTSPLPTLAPLDAGLDAEAGVDSYAEADATVGPASGGVVIAAAVPESASELYGLSREPDASDDSSSDDDDGGDANDSGDDGGGVLGPPADGGPAAPDGGAPDGGSAPGGDVDRPPTRRYERLSLAWYVERGTLDMGTTTLEGAREDVAARDWSSLLLNRWAPKGAGSVEIIVVVRDERGGIGWLRQRTP